MITDEPGQIIEFDSRAFFSEVGSIDPWQPTMRLHPTADVIPMTAAAITAANLATLGVIA